MRDIKQVLRGFIPGGEIKEWDVTPTVTATPAIFTDEGIHNATFDGTLLHVNGLANSDPLYIGAMKTALTMQALSDGDGYRYSVRLADILSEGALIFGIAVLPSTMSASDAAAELFTTVSGTPSTPSIFSIMLRATSEKQSLLMGSVATDLVPSFSIGAAISVTNSFVADTEYTEHLFIRKYNGKLYLAKELVDSDGITYNILGMTEIANNPVIADDLTVFVFAGSLLMSGGVAPTHGNFFIEPTCALAPLTTNVAGTAFELQIGDQTVFDGYFPIIKQPVGTTVTQKTFPLGTRPLEQYKTKVVGQVGVPIAPYGITVSPNQILVVNNVDLGSESFTPLVDNASISDLLAPVFTQQTAMLQSIAEIGSLVQQTATDVNKALINAGEMIVFVKDNVDNTDLNSNITFNTLEAAYAYLITFPHFIKKRIVLDDRSGFLLAGNGETYNCAANNVVLSTYLAYTGKPVFKTPSIGASGGLNTYILGTFTGLVLDHFEGRLDGSGLIKNISPSLPYGLQLNESFFIADKSAFDLPELASSTTVTLTNHSCFIYTGAFNDADGQTHPHLDVIASEDSSFDLETNTPTPGVGVTDKILLMRSTSLRADNIPTNFITSRYVRRGSDNPLTVRIGDLNQLLWLIGLANADNLVVRHPADFGEPSQSYPNRLYPLAKRLIIAGEIHLGNLQLSTFANTLTLIGLPGASLNANASAITIANGAVVLEINNLTIKSDGTTYPAITAEDTNSNGYPSLIMNDCTVDAQNAIEWIAAPFISNANSFELTRVKFLNLRASIAVQAVSVTKLRDISVDNQGSPALPVLSIAFKTESYQPKSILIIDGVDHITTNTDNNGNLPPILDIRGTYIPSEADTTTHIDISNVRTIKQYSNQVYREVNVLLQGLPYDYYDDTNFETDQGDSYAILTGTMSFNIGDVALAHQGSLTGITDSQLRKFQLENYGISYRGARQRRFKVSISGKSQCNSSIYQLLFQRVKTSTMGGFGTPDTTILKNIQFTGTANTVRDFTCERIVTLREDYSLAIFAANIDNVQDVFLTDLVWGITEL